MRILLSGGSGLLGTALQQRLQASGHELRTLVRRDPVSTSEFRWDPARQRLDPEALAGVDAVINLSGAALGGRPWTARYKELLYSSRLDSTRTLAAAMAAAQEPPRIFLSSSATGFYGQHGPVPATEDAPAGRNSMLADICGQWEAAAGTAPARTRTVLMRTAVVLTPSGGALGRLLPLLKWGVGGALGSGRQYWPWISLPDYLAAVEFLLSTDVSGPVNLSSPEPASVAELVGALAAQLHRPARLRIPAFALRLLLGEMAKEMLLTSTLTRPAVLLHHGFGFSHPGAEAAAAWVIHPDQSAASH